MTSAEPPAGAGDPIAEPAAGGTRLYNIANALTMLRILLVPVFVWLLFQDGTAARLGAFGVFAVASFTDRLDGELARKRNLVTDFGKIADPIADKALTGSALVCLSVLGELWWWVTIAILVREIGITVMRLVIIRYGVIPASKGGKLKTMLQVLAIGLFILPGPFDPARWALMGAALVVTVVTGLDYVHQAWRLRHTATVRGGDDGGAGRAGRSGNGEPCGAEPHPSGIAGNTGQMSPVVEEVESAESPGSGDTTGTKG